MLLAAAFAFAAAVWAVVVALIRRHVDAGRRWYAGVYAVLPVFVTLGLRWQFSLPAALTAVGAIGLLLLACTAGRPHLMIESDERDEHGRPSAVAAARVRLMRLLFLGSCFALLVVLALYFGQPPR